MRERTEITSVSGVADRVIRFGSAVSPSPTSADYSGACETSI